MSPNIMTYPIKIGVNQSIRVSENHNTKFREIGIAFFIRSFVFRDQVLSAVKFNDDFLAFNIKIDNIIENHFLAVNHDRQRFQKLIP